MSKKLISLITLPLLLLFWNGVEISQAQSKKNNAAAPSGTLQKMIVANGVVTMNLQRPGAGNQSDVARFNVAPDSFFTLLVFNDQLRGPLPSAMTLTAQNGAALPSVLKNSANQLIIEKTGSGGNFDLVIRDSQSGSVLYNIEGHQYNYDAAKHLLTVTEGRLRTTAGEPAGTISITATLLPIEIDNVVNGDVKSATLPAVHQPAVGTVPGPDVIVGDLIGLDQEQPGTVNGRVGLALGTDACNQGTIDADWFSLPNADHPFIPQNLYRMSGGAGNTDQFEQIGQSWGKHAFTAASSNSCGFGCNGVGGSHLGSGCSDAYGSGLNGSQTGIGSRAWVNPFTGNFNGSTANNHSGHTHDVTSHRILVDVNDLNTSMNPGATYYAEAQYIVPHEYTWCASHPGQCNMYNNASYRRYNVTGINQPFTFASVGATVRQQPAIMAWTGATVVPIQPTLGVDGTGLVAYKVTNPGVGTWHYEYAIYNQNLDRAIQSFSVPLGCGVTASNFGFHMPPQHPGFANDGTLNNQGYSNAPWLPNPTSASVTWSCETFAQNQNANAIRFGTLYNFRFDSNKPPTAVPVAATIGFFKTGAPITVAVLAPMADPCNPLQLDSVVSRKTHGSAGDFDVALPVGGSAGVECRSTSGNHIFVFTLTNNVVSGNAAVTSGTGTVSGSPAFSGNTMTVNLTGVTDQQQITVTISNVMDTFGQTLPDTSVNAVILAGDTNGNSTVNAADVAQTKAQQGAPVDQTNFRTDVNANGTINAADTALVKGSLGDSVP